MTNAVEPRRDWFEIGKHYHETAALKGQMSIYIAELEWHELPESMPMAPGMAIKELIREFHIPKVSVVAWNVVAFNRYGLIGIEGNYRNGRARIYALDRGSDLVPVAADFLAGDAMTISRMLSSFMEPLEYIPVKHTCGHFELRCTRWSTHRIGTGNVPQAVDPETIGHLTAGNPCTHCNAQGRPLQPSYPTLADAQRMKPELDATLPQLARRQS